MSSGVSFTLLVKFSTHLNIPGHSVGVGAEDEGRWPTSPRTPILWFTLAKRSEDLVPTVYTLWKKPDLLPVLTTEMNVPSFHFRHSSLLLPLAVSRPFKCKLVVQLPGINAPLHADQLGAIPMDGTVGRGSARAWRVGTGGKAVLLPHMRRTGQEEVADEVGLESTPSRQEAISTLRTALLQPLANNRQDLLHDPHLPIRLAAAEEGTLVKLKELEAGKGVELVLMGVFPKHIDDALAKKEQRAEAEGKNVKVMEVRAHGVVEAAGEGTPTRYAMSKLKKSINGCIAAHALVNQNDQPYTNLDALLRSAIAAKNSTDALEFIKRNELKPDSEGGGQDSALARDHHGWERAYHQPEGRAEARIGGGGGCEYHAYVFCELASLRAPIYTSKLVRKFTEHPAGCTGRRDGTLYSPRDQCRSAYLYLPAPPASTETTGGDGITLGERARFYPSALTIPPQISPHARTHL
ncbi:hypothetical protein FIBSPDRAFT_926587 [Athelia psychrophila]|uniref:Uncharacterized protein n=1 Tax=Athelia psychrophila TaxID=1759441 RepID=A0A166T0U2_9AGAM|nr:hypothetical protein FIBSPDRAFT_926587 [Fibularhizoctonia sp. CBS 109695]